MKYHIYKKVTELGYTVYFIRDENDKFMDIGMESCHTDASPDEHLIAQQKLTNKLLNHLNGYTNESLVKTIEI